MELDSLIDFLTFPAVIKYLLTEFHAETNSIETYFFIFIIF